MVANSQEMLLFYNLAEKGQVQCPFPAPILHVGAAPYSVPNECGIARSASCVAQVSDLIFFILVCGISPQSSILLGTAFLSHPTQPSFLHSLTTLISILIIVILTLLYLLYDWVLLAFENFSPRTFINIFKAFVVVQF